MLSSKLLVAAWLVGAVLIVGCGAEPSPEAGASDQALVEAAAAGSSEAEAELERRDLTIEKFEAAVDAARRRGVSVPASVGKRVDRSKRMFDLEARTADPASADTPVDKALDSLPLHKPPLKVFQWVETDLGNDLVSASKATRGRFYRMSAADRATFLAPKVSHQVFARVDRNHWYHLTQQERARAFSAFYRDARKAFARNGIDDLELVIAPLNPTTEHLPALAVGKNGTASLTRLGRERRTPQL